MSEHIAWLRDLDGTGSLHPCAEGDSGAIEFVSANTLTRKQALIESQQATINELVEAMHGLRRIMLPMHMTMAEAECVDEPIPDDAVFLSFMGSGASDQVTAGEFRRANDAAGNALSKLKEQS